MELNIQELTDEQLITIARTLNGRQEAICIANYLNNERGYCIHINPWAEKNINID